MISIAKYLLLAILLLHANWAQAEPLRVVTSLETFADLARAVGGDKVQVQALARGYQDPHFVEAKPNLLVPLSRADLLVYAGLDLEIGWLPPLVTGSRNPRIQPGSKGNLDASTAIDVLDVPAGRVDRGQGDIHPRGNPHYWLPPVNALKVAKEIAARLKELDPVHGADYDGNLQKFAALLKSKASDWSRQRVRSWYRPRNQSAATQASPKRAATTRMSSPSRCQMSIHSPSPKRAIEASRKTAVALAQSAAIRPSRRAIMYRRITAGGPPCRGR